MTDKDTIQKDGQEVLTPSTGLRASNTLETLRPKEVNIGFGPQGPQPLQGRGLPPIDFEEPVRKADYSNVPLTRNPQTGEIEKFEGPLPVSYPQSPEMYNVLPVDWPTAEETMGFQEVERAYGVLQLPLTERVLWLEEQVSGLLDRIAIYNTKSSHKL